MKTKLTSLVILVLAIVLASCSKKKEEPVYFHTTFTAGAQQLDFKTTSSFGKFCITTKYCNNFYATPGVIGTNEIMIGLPSTTATGVTLHNGDGIQLVYFDAAGRGFYSGASDSAEVYISQWDGHGGWAKGTYSGKLRYSGQDPADYDSIYITNGSFSSRIWFTTGN
jgi:hypothetical protein